MTITDADARALATLHPDVLTEVWTAARSLARRLTTDADTAEDVALAALCYAAQDNRLTAADARPGDALTQGLSRTARAVVRWRLTDAHRAADVRPTPVDLSADTPAIRIWTAATPEPGPQWGPMDTVRTACPDDAARQAIARILRPALAAHAALPAGTPCPPLPQCIGGPQSTARLRVRQAVAPIRAALGLTGAGPTHRPWGPPSPAWDARTGIPMTQTAGPIDATAWPCPPSGPASLPLAWTPAPGARRVFAVPSAQTTHADGQPTRTTRHAPTIRWTAYTLVTAGDWTPREPITTDDPAAWTREHAHGLAALTAARPTDTDAAADRWALRLAWRLGPVRKPSSRRRPRVGSTGPTVPLQPARTPTTPTTGPAQRLAEGLPPRAEEPGPTRIYAPPLAQPVPLRPAPGSTRWTRPEPLTPPTHEAPSVANGMWDHAVWRTDAERAHRLAHGSWTSPLCRPAPADCPCRLPLPLAMARAQDHAPTPVEVAHPLTPGPAPVVHPRATGPYAPRLATAPAQPLPLGTADRIAHDAWRARRIARRAAFAEACVRAWPFRPWGPTAAAHTTR